MDPVIGLSTDAGDDLKPAHRPNMTKPLTCQTGSCAHMLKRTSKPEADRCVVCFYFLIHPCVLQLRRESSGPFAIATLIASLRDPRARGCTCTARATCRPAKGHSSMAHCWPYKLLWPPLWPSSPSLSIVLMTIAPASESDLEHLQAFAHLSVSILRKMLAATQLHNSVLWCRDII